MNFFEEQERARRRTGWLILLFSFAVCGTVTAVYVAIRLALYYGFADQLGQGPGRFWIWELFWRVAACVVGLIAVSSFFKIRALDASAESIALRLGARLVDSDTTDAHERRLLNVVEEMAIASGVPVPTV